MKSNVELMQTIRELELLNLQLRKDVRSEKLKNKYSSQKIEYVEEPKSIKPKQIISENMPKLHSPFVREEINGVYVVTPEITEGYEWVFEDESVMAIEKLHGTNVSVIIEGGAVTSVWNRTSRIPFLNKGKKFIIEGLLESKERGYLEFPDGQWYGELIGPKVNGNPYKVDKHIWIPYATYGVKNLKYKSWGKYPKDFDTISDWFKELIPLYALSKGDKEGFVEGVVFTHPDGRMAKLRCDMFDWFKGRRH